MAPTETMVSTADDTLQAWRRRIGKLDPRQIAAWRAMSPAQRLDLACQAYPFALDAVRLTERHLGGFDPLTRILSGGGTITTDEGSAPFSLDVTP